MISGCSAVGSVLEWGSRGRKFESSHSDQQKVLYSQGIQDFLFSVLRANYRYGVQQVCNRNYLSESCFTDWLSPVAVGTSTMIMTLVALTGAVSHISLGTQLFPLPMAIVVASCLLGAVVSAKFANRCEIRRLNRIVGVVLILLGAVTILIKLL